MSVILALGCEFFPLKCRFPHGASFLSFLLSRNQTSLVNLKLLRNGEKVDQVVYGKDYMLRADITHPDGKKRDKCDRIWD